ncbi:hypothetical protein ACWDA7_50930, partial [Streptomyces sp. NPDC001156]
MDTGDDDEFSCSLRRRRRLQPPEGPAGTCRHGPGQQADGPTGADDTSDQTPFEQISAAVEQLDADVATELVQRLHAAPPEFLEKAVLRLLVGMGYGG